MSVLQIGNLGSSYAAGPTIPPSVGPVAAGRSGNNFAHLVAKHFNGNLTDLSVSGATLDNVLTQKQTVGNTTLNPQLQDLPPNQDVVFILGGECSANCRDKSPGERPQTLSFAYLPRSWTRGQ